MLGSWKIVNVFIKFRVVVLLALHFSFHNLFDNRGVVKANELVELGQF